MAKSCTKSINWSSREENNNYKKTVTIFVSSGLNYFDWISQLSTTSNIQKITYSAISETKRDSTDLLRPT